MAFDKKNILTWFAILSAASTVIFWGYNFIGDSAKDELIIEQTTFDSHTQKVEHVEHVKNSPDEADTREMNIEIKRVLEDVKKDKTDAIRSRRIRDSIGRERDTLAQRQAVTIFQLKETMEAQTEINKQILIKLEDNN